MNLSKNRFEPILHDGHTYRVAHYGPGWAIFKDSKFFDGTYWTPLEAQDMLDQLTGQISSR